MSITPPSTPPSNWHSSISTQEHEETNASKINSDDFEREPRTPQNNFGGIDSGDLYNIYNDTKRLTCTRCPFVTEHKHHMEYHVLTHLGVMPLKPHSNVYLYRCADCAYATKYCYSLKTHLRRYNHTSGAGINLDATPNRMPVMNGYGRRRGLKIKTPRTRDIIGEIKQEFEAMSYTRRLSQLTLHPKVGIDRPLYRPWLHSAQMPKQNPVVHFFLPQPLLLPNVNETASEQINLLTCPVDLQYAAGPSQPDAVGPVGQVLDIDSNRNSSTFEKLATMFSNLNMVGEMEGETHEEAQMKRMEGNSANSCDSTSTITNDSTSSSTDFIF